MDNPSFNNDENKWVEDRIGKLSPPPGWKPDTDRAIERVLQREPASTSRGLRVSMAAGTLAVIAFVLTLLPWHVLWTPEKNETPVAAQHPAVAPTPASPTPPPPKA